MECQRSRVGFEILAQLLGFALPIRGVRDERTPAVLVHNYGEGRFGPRFQLADGQHERLALEWNQGGKRQALLFVETRHANLPFIRAEHEDFGFAISIPVSDRQIADAGERRESFRGGQRTILLLEMERDLPALGLGDEQVRQAIAINIGPAQAAAGLVGEGG